MHENEENVLLEPETEEKNPLPRRRTIAVFCVVLILLFVAGVILGYCVGKKDSTAKEEDIANELASCRHGHDTMKVALSCPQLLMELHQAYLREINFHPLSWLRDHYSNQVYSGSDADQLVVVDIVKHLHKLGVFDEVRVENYTALLSLPDPEGSLLQVVNRSDDSVLYRERICADTENKTSDDSVHRTQRHHHHGHVKQGSNITEMRVPPFVAYSKPGTVQGELVNINFGLESDFKALLRAQIVLTNKIGLMRKDDSEATVEPLLDKIYRAESYNLSAVLIYRDGSYCDTLAHYENLNSLGDPQTPGYASIDGVWRQSVMDVKFPRIPVQTILCDTAHQLLRLMSGHVAPTHWQGNYNGTVFMGRKSKKPDTWYVQLNTANSYVQRKIQNVIATIRGFISPRQTVMLGASRTSFKTGYQGAALSTEALLRLARPLVYLVKENKWLPKRSITFSFWGGSEFGNIGLTEFMEKSTSMIRDVVAYIDIDNQNMAAELSVITSESLRELVASTISTRVISLSDTDVYTYETDSYFNDDEDSDEEEYSGSDVSGSVGDVLSQVQYVDPDDLPELRWCQMPIVQTSIGYKIPEALTSRLRGEITKLDALLMLSLADQVVIQYDNVATVKAIKSGIRRLLFSAHHLEDDLRVALETKSASLLKSVAIFDHMIDNQMDYSNENFVSSVNVILLQLNSQLADVRTRLSDLLTSLPAIRPSDDLILGDDVTTYSAATLRQFSRLLISLQNANELMKTVHFHVITNNSGNGTRSLDVSDENMDDLERGWI